MQTAAPRSLHPIYSILTSPINRYIKVVYSNNPAELAKVCMELFGRSDKVAWYPENTMGGAEYKKLALGAYLENYEVVITNSLQVLKGFHLGRHDHPRNVMFYYVEFETLEQSTVVPVQIDVEPKLTLYAVPQFGWYGEQDEVFVKTER